MSIPNKPCNLNKGLTFAPLIMITQFIQLCYASSVHTVISENVSGYNY